MERIPWPTTSGGLTPDDIPYGYSAFNTTFDDGRGYEPVVIGHEWSEFGDLVILVALSPGAVISVTVVTPGQAPGEAEAAVLDTIEGLRAGQSSSRELGSANPGGLPAPGHQAREALP